MSTVGIALVASGCDSSDSAAPTKSFRENVPVAAPTQPGQKKPAKAVLKNRQVRGIGVPQGGTKPE
jgi:hypothetical protein